MVELDQFKYRISGYDAQIENIKQSLDLDSKKKRIEELEADMEAPGFWDDPDKSNKAMKELKTLKDSFEGYNSLKSGLEDINTLIEMADEMQDDSLISEIEDEITVFEEKMESLLSPFSPRIQLSHLLSQKLMSRPAFHLPSQ